MNIMPVPKQQYDGIAGLPLIGGKLYTYAAGTTTPKATYSDSNGTVPQANPIVLNARGEPANAIYWSGAYKVTLTDALGNLIYTVDNYEAPVSQGDISGAAGAGLVGFVYATAYAAGSIGRWLKDLALAAGASFIGWAQAGAGAVTRTVESKLRDVVSVNDFVTGGDGTTANPWTGWDTRIVWATRKKYEFIDGYYSYATSPNFAKDFLELRGSSGTVVRHTGTGYAMLIDAGPGASQINIGVKISGIRIEANATSTGGVYERGLVHSDIQVSFHNVPGICYTQVYGVLNNYSIEHSGLVDGISITPGYLLSVIQRNAGEVPSANRYNRLIAENCSIFGVVLNDCVNSIFDGGTSEGNGGGYSISATSKYNTFINLDLEANTGLDINCVGQYNTFISILSSGEATINGLGNVVIGGIFNKINAGGANNSFGPLSYAASGGAFTISGTNITKRAVYNIAGAAVDVDRISPVVDLNYTGTFTGGTGIINIGAGQFYKTAAGEILVGATTPIGPGKLQVTNPNNTANDQNWRSILGAAANTTTAYHLICSTGAGVDKLYIFGNGNVQNANNSYGAISDIKLKENIADASPKLADLMRVRIVNYGLKSDPGSKFIGVIAQELESIFPGMIEENQDHIQVKKLREATPEIPAIPAVPGVPEVAAVLNIDGEIMTPLIPAIPAIAEIPAVPAVMEEYFDSVPNGEFTKGVKYSVFVPILIKAMQELKTEFDNYKGSHP